MGLRLRMRLEVQLMATDERLVVVDGTMHLRPEQPQRLDRQEIRAVDVAGDGRPRHLQRVGEAHDVARPGDLRRDDVIEHVDEPGQPVFLNVPHDTADIAQQQAAQVIGLGWRELERRLNDLFQEVRPLRREALGDGRLG